MKLKLSSGLSSAAALGLLSFACTATAVAPIQIRWASDHSGPPHPAAIAEVFFAEALEKRVPGSKVQLFWANSLYDIPKGARALTQGNLEMLTGQFGKTASIEPYANVMLGAGKLTTPGAVAKINTTETYKKVVELMSKKHQITVLGSGDMSMFMGAGGTKSRYVTPADFKGNKIRSMGPAENAMLSALGANPTAMAFGDVPPALQTGVLDGLLTSVGGWNSVKEQAPYYTVAGMNGIVGDYYWFGISQRWWSKLSKEQQAVIKDVFEKEFLPFQRAINYCSDKRVIDQFVTTDKTKPGIYVMTPDEAAVIKKAEGGATNRWIKTRVDAEGAKLVDAFDKEADKLVKENPLGSSAVEKLDCRQYESHFARYGKGGDLTNAKARK
jgi:TRAP-type C4-dicarboxylate transport system substrate-binding protein